MRRVHFVELEDLPWMPRAVRDGATDLLDLLFARTHFYRPLAPKLAALIEVTSQKTIVDLCSGGGGGLLAMCEELDAVAAQDLHCLLTDRHPNASAMERVRALGTPRVKYRSEPLDALQATPDLQGIRTMFGALHHFKPDEVRELVASAISSGMPFAFFDVAASPILRALPAPLFPLVMLPNIIFLLIVTLLLAPVAKPFRLSRILLTYLIPAIPIVFAWDGTVSAIRAYSPEELLELARSAPGANRYQIEAERGGQALCLIGRPMKVS